MGSVRKLLHFCVALRERIRSHRRMRFAWLRRPLLAIPLLLVVAASTAAGPSTGAADAIVDHTGHVVALAAAPDPTVPAAVVPAARGTFLETFDGAPSGPLSFANPNSWDILPTGLDSRQNGTDAQRAHHGPTCGAPGFPYSPANSHPLLATSDMVFICNNHLMTATGLTGYGAIYMVPPAMADFSASAATISFEMSTLRTASRDWVYFTLMPFYGHNKYAYNSLDQAIPENNINIQLAGTDSFTATQRAGNGVDTRIGGDGYTTWDMVQAANGVAPDAARRDMFQIEISRTHLRVCLTGNSAGQTYTYRGESGFCWIDADLPTPLSSGVWNDQAVFMITHVAYNPEKSCSSEDDQFSIVHNVTGDANCPPNTWHWDNVRIAPATSFTIINPLQQFASFTDPGAANTVVLARPAPAGAFLSYVADGDCTQQRFSVNGGASWIAAVPQPAATQCRHPENGGEYWTPIPEGATSVKFTGQETFGKWGVSGVAVWAGGGTLPTLTQQPLVPGPPSAVAPPAPVQQPLVGQVPSDTGFHSSWVGQSEYPTLPQGAIGSVTLRFRNSGRETWRVGQPGAQVNLGILRDATTYSDLGMAVGWLSSNRPATTQQQTVAPGEIGTFVFAVRAPTTPGVYRLPLGLVADGVAWLEDQGTYIDVISDPGHHSAWVSQSPWPVLRAGEISQPLSLMFLNTGATTWARGSDTQVSLGVTDDDASWGPLGVSWLSANRPAVQLEAAVGPGAIATFTLQVRAPAEPGQYVLALRPVIDGVMWLEDDGVFFLVTVVP